MRRPRKFRIALLGALAVASGLAPGVSNAEVCHLGGALWTHQVVRMTVPPGGSFPGVEWQLYTPTAFPYVYDDDHFGAMGIYIVGSGNLTPSIWAVDGSGENSPRAVVNVNGTTYVNQFIPGMNFGYGGIQGGDRRHPAGLGGGGTYYIIAFGVGPRNAIPNQGYWWVDVDAGGTCTPVSAPREIYSFDETDFGPRDKFSSHFHTPWFGAGSRLRYTHHVTRSKAYGLAYSIADPNEVPGAGKSDLRWTSTAGPSGRVGTVANDAINKLTSAGPADISFDLDYQGADPLNTAVLLEVDF